MALVIDASAAAALAFADEEQGYAEAVLRTMTRSLAFVPALFWFEFRNVLVVNERRGRVTSQQTDLLLTRFRSLPIRTDYHPDEASVLNLSRQYGLTVYDASYLEVAMRRRLPLATKDQELISAAPRVGVVRWTP